MPRRVTQLNNFLSTPLKQNIDWLDEYKVNSNITDGIYQKLFNFFRYVNFSLKPFNDFTNRDINDYLKECNKNDYSQDTNNTLLSHISKYREYLIKEHPKIFKADFLSDLNTLRTNDKSDPRGKPLNLVQLSMIRQFNSQNPKIEYAFELLFQLGIQKQEIEYCTPQYAVTQNNEFVPPNKKGIKYNKAISKLLEKHSNIDISYNSINEYLQKITDFLRSKGLYKKSGKLTIYDIKATRDNFFIVCPNCKEKFESFAYNWVLAKTEIDDEYHLVCASCKGEPKDED